MAEDANADVQLQSLESVVKNGNRKKFMYISKQDMIEAVSYNLTTS